MIRTFEHNGLVVMVEAPEDDAAWLAEFLAPAFAETPAVPADVHVSFRPGPPGGMPSAGAGPAGAPADASPRGAPSAANTERPVVFAFDSGPVRLAASSSANGLRLFDATNHVTVDVAPSSRRVCLAYHADRLRARVQMMRIVREFAHNHSIALGGVLLHAAAVGRAGSAVAIVGGKGAGKTTTVMRLLERPGVAYLANDRIVVRAGAEVRALAVPTVVSIRAGTRACFPAVTARLERCGDFREHAREREARAPSPPDTLDDTWRVAPHQLAASLGCPAVANAALRSVLFLSPGPSPDRSLDHPGRQLRRLDEAKAAAALADALIGGANGTYSSDVFRDASARIPGREAMRSRCEDLASRLVCVEGWLPGDAPDGNAEALLQECLDACP